MVSEYKVYLNGQEIGTIRPSCELTIGGRKIRGVHHAAMVPSWLGMKTADTIDKPRQIAPDGA